MKLKIYLPPNICQNAQKKKAVVKPPVHKVIGDCNVNSLAQKFNFFCNTCCDYSSYSEVKGYYSDNSTNSWEPICPEDVEPEKGFGPGAVTRGEIDDYDWSDCEEF